MVRTNRHLTSLLSAAALLLGLTLQAPAVRSQATDVVCSGCIQATDIENGTIGPNKLVPGSINATTIANGSIGPNKLIPGSINRFTIATDAIRSNKILDGAVKSADIGDGEVTSADIADGTITGSDIAAGSITDAEVLDSSLTATDLGNEAGTDFTSGDDVVGLDLASNFIIRTLVISAPTNGFIIANASASWSTGLGVSGVLCSISTDTVVDSTHHIAAFTNDMTTTVMPIAGTRAFPVSSGATTVSFICSRHPSATLGGTLFDPSLNALFVPTLY